MGNFHRKLISAIVVLFLSGAPAPANQDAAETVRAQGQTKEDPAFPSAYVLGPDDQIAIRILEAPEIAEKPVRIEPDGYIELPLVGRLRASGLTATELKDALTAKLRTYIREPKVTITVEEFRSQPVSVIGAVNSPGIHQLRGRKSLVEVLSMAGGLRPDAGYNVKITRQLEWGRIDLPNAVTDASGRFSVAELSLKSIMEARNPDANILAKPNDVISVPRAEMVYVVGEVEKAGGFVLNERETVSALQALSLAGGLRPTAARQTARILRPTDSPDRKEIPVNLAKLLTGRSEDIMLRPGDILFVPSSATRRAGVRALETAISIGTGVVIWRR
jgi:polysaccharide biosynthesis/export protein